MVSLRSGPEMIEGLLHRLAAQHLVKEIKHCRPVLAGERMAVVGSRGISRPKNPDMSYIAIHPVSLLSHVPRANTFLMTFQRWRRSARRNALVLALISL